MKVSLPLLCILLFTGCANIQKFFNLSKSENKPPTTSENVDSTTVDSTFVRITSVTVLHPASAMEIHTIIIPVFGLAPGTLWELRHKSSHSIYIGGHEEGMIVKGRDCCWFIWDLAKDSDDVTAIPGISIREIIRENK